jgi:endonuclease/exonuclease/phosphatase family metal-dependent hydrolase
LQEMTGEAADYFDTELADLYPYRAFHPFANYFYGRAVLSRYPITADYSWPETAPITVRLQRVKIDVNGFPLTLYNFHAPPSRPIWGQGFDFQPRIGQIADLLKLARQDSGAVLLMGDFNTHDFDEDYGRITTDFGDVFREAGWGMGLTNPDWTWDNSREGPAWMPLYDRLDYIFFSDDFQAVDAHVWTTSGGSDHRPVFAALALLE